MHKYLITAIVIEIRLVMATRIKVDQKRCKLLSRNNRSLGRLQVHCLRLQPLD